MSPDVKQPGALADARAAVAANPVWYHTLELAPGVVTPGYVDLRRTARRVLPGDLRGRRALDVGTFDGFWAFEMERRGAETVAIDVDRLDRAQWPPLRRTELEARARELDVELGRGFRLAAAALHSQVRRVECDVHDLQPEAIGGQVDLAFAGAILLHLRDPVGALERISDALRPGGELVLLETISLPDTVRSPRRPLAHFQPLRTSFNWWVPNVSALKAWLWTAGFVDVQLAGLHRPPSRREMRAWYAGMRARRK